MKTALGYIRRSFIKVGQHTDSPAKQRSNIERTCQEKGWNVEWYEDAAEGKHFSGRSEENRPAWQQLKLQLTRSDVAAVVVNSLDRASRSPKDFFNFLDLLEKQDVALVSCKEQFDTTTPMGRAFLAILMIVASLESDMASERISSTIDYRRSKGLHWGNTPYGYEKLEDGTMIESGDAPTIRDIYEMYATGQWSYYRIAKHLNAQGVRMTNRYDERKPFDKKNIRTFIHNHWLYRGWIVPNGHHGNYIFEHDETEPPTGAIQGQFPALVSQDLAVTVAKALRVRQDMAPKRRPDRVYLLTPILHCANCGTQLRGSITRGEYFYIHRGPTCQKGYGAMPVKPLERHIIGLLRDFQLPEEWKSELQALLRARIEQMQSPGQRQMTDNATRLRKALERLQDLYVYGHISEADYHNKHQELLHQISAFEAQQVRPPYDIDELLQRLETLGERIALANPETQKELISTIFTRLEAKQNGAGRWIISGATVRQVFETLFHDMKNCCHQCPQGNSNPCRGLERAVS